MDDSLFQLEGKSALVVGGGKGIGESTARLLARVGCGVAVADVVKAQADHVAAVVAGLGQPSTVDRRRRAGRHPGEGHRGARRARAGRPRRAGDDRRPSVVQSDPRHDARAVGPRSPQEPALFLLHRPGGRPVAHRPRRARQHRLHLVGGRRAVGSQSRVVWRGEGRPDQLGAQHGRRVGAARHPRQTRSRRAASSRRGSRRRRSGSNAPGRGSSPASASARPTKWARPPSSCSPTWRAT